jgi:hypothetical protein
MKCPLRSLSSKGAYDQAQYEDLDCLKEQCSWWDDGHPGCSILTIAQELAIKRQKEELE